MPSENPPMDVACSMIGSREHYLLPRALHRLGILSRFYTDIWFPPGVQRLSGISGRLRSAAKKRFHPELADVPVYHRSLRSLWNEFRHRRRPGTTESNYAYYLQTDAAFDRFVAASLRHHRPSAFVGFTSASLESIRTVRAGGGRAIVDQIDASREEQTLVREEREAWSGWEAEPGDIPEAYYERLQAEWAEADTVIVNSAFAKACIIRQGAQADKIAILPLAYSPTEKGTPRSSEKRGPLRVLWVGQMILRKGLPYAIEAARSMTAAEAHFTFIGRCGVRTEKLRDLPANVTVLPHVPHHELRNHFDDADVFILPTVSDGFAITQIEAMSYGLPVIATPNCGDVVADGKDGFIIPIRNAAALRDALGRLAADRQLLAEMSHAALAKAELFSVGRYVDNLGRFIGSVPNGQ